MPAFYVDHDVANDVAMYSSLAGYNVVTVRNLKTTKAKDSFHLLSAAHDGRVLVSHNRRDYELLHDAWPRWSRDWNVHPVHHGILILPHGPPRRTFQAIIDLLASGQSLSNALYQWRPTAGWTRTA